MAESSEGHPSLEGIFQILAQASTDRLVHYKHKLSCLRQDRRSCQLLHAMILLTLKREVEAQTRLGVLGDDPAAACIYWSHWGSSAENAANAIPPNHDAEVKLAVAQIYSLLVDEKLCSPPARDEAYRAAIAAFRSGGMAKDRLQSLLDEAIKKCGTGFTSSHFDSQGVQRGMPPAPRMASDPVPIRSSLDPQPLRSTGTPMSIISHLEISQSPTAPFLTDCASHDSAPSIRERNSLESAASAWSNNGSSFSELEENGRTSDFKGSCCSSSGPPDSKVQHLAKSNIAGQQSPSGSLSCNPQTSSATQFGPAVSTGSGEGSSCPKPISNPGPPSAPSFTTHSTGTEPDAQEFFTFVVLHANEDEAIACRVKDLLESLGVSNGATFNEDFLIPGCCQLGCFQNALDNSAFRLLLLTENFRSRFCAYQTGVALMDSLIHFCKTNTVIPFICKERPLKAREMPLLLASLVPLDENSPVFARRVKKTFKDEDIQEKKAAWRQRRQIQEKKLSQERWWEYQQTMHQLSALSMNAPSAMPFPGPLAGFPPGPLPYLNPAPSASGAVQPGPDQPSLSQPVLLSLGSGGPQPHLIIQNAQMVQIGDYNHMQVERTNATLGRAEEEPRMGNGGVGNGHCD